MALKTEGNLFSNSKQKLLKVMNHECTHKMKIANSCSTNINEIIFDDVLSTFLSIYTSLYNRIELLRTSGSSTSKQVNIYNSSYACCDRRLAIK